MDGLFTKLKHLLLASPEYAYEFLNNLALEKPNKILETLICNSDKVPRTAAGEILSICINLVIIFEGFDMNIYKLNETYKKY